MEKKAPGVMPGAFVIKGVFINKYYKDTPRFQGIKSS
jgi:hypothetical protein